jgi:hypothetical protein
MDQGQPGQANQGQQGQAANPENAPDKANRAEGKDDSMSREKKAQREEGSKSKDEGSKAAGKEEDRERKGTAEADKSRDKDRAGADSEDRKAVERKSDDGKSAGRDEGDQRAGGRGGSKVTLDSNQRTKIETYFRENKPTGHRVERSVVSVSIGVAVPTTIALAPLPPDIIVVSGSCPLEYFLWGDDLVIVDSCSRHVVEILPGLA